MIRKMTGRQLALLVPGVMLSTLGAVFTTVLDVPPWLTIPLQLVGVALLGAVVAMMVADARGEEE